DEFHRDQPLLIEIEQFVQLDQIPVLVESSERSEFAFEVKKALRSGLLECFDGDDAAPMAIIGLVHNPIRPCSNSSLDLESRTVSENRKARGHQGTALC